MLTLLEGFPDSVVALAAHGRLTRRDYEDVVMPRVKAAMRGPGGVRLYYELAGDFSGVEAGAVWEDFKVGVEHWARWERLALVTDIAWIRAAVGAFGFLMPGRIRVFDMTQCREARDWIVAQTH